MADKDVKESKVAVTRTEIPDAARERQMAIASRGFAFAADPAAPLVQDLPTIPDGVYDVGEEIARGGLGRILRARDLRLDRVVALKQLALPHPHARARFAREVLITARLTHPNIIALHEAGRWKDGTPFYSMELVDGRSLAEALDATETFEERLAMLPHVTAVAEAVAYAHNQRIIHRDLKPANVLVGPFGETVVIDWGLAKDLDSGPEDEIDPERSRVTGGFDTSDGAVLGTPAYMPPEQATGAEVDERADVYALGAMLYQMLSAVRPYHETPPDRLLARIIEHAPTPVAELAPNAPRDLCAIVDKAMAREPSRRYRNAGEMAEELRRFSAGRMVGAHDYSTWELLSRFARRARGVLLTALVALIVLAVFGTLSVRRVARERDRASDNARAAELSRAEAVRAHASTEASLRAATLAQARALLATDPTEAAALVRDLAPRPAGADSILAEADERGVARRILQGAGDRLRAIATDGTRVIAGGDDGLYLWPADALEATRIDGHTDRVSALALSADGARLVTGSYDRTVRVWTTVDWESTAMRGHADKVKDVAWVDAEHVASVDASGAVWLWRTATSTGRALRLDGPTDSAMSAGAGLVAAAGASPTTIDVWTTDDAPVRVLGGHTSAVTAVAVCSRGRWLVSGDAAGAVWRWDLTSDTGSRVGATGRAVVAVACAANGGAIAAADADGAVYTSQRGPGELRRRGAHDRPVTWLAMSADGAQVLSASEDKTARIWRRSSDDFRALLGHGDAIASAAFAGDVLVTAAFDKTARVWPLEGPRSLTIGRHSGGVRSVAVSPDGARVASAGRDGAVGMWDAAGDGGALWPGHASKVLYRVLFSPDGGTVASSSDDRTVRLWNARTGESRPLFGHRGDVEELAFSPDGVWLASASKDDTVWLWNVASGKGRRIVRHGKDVTSVGFSPDGMRLASTGRDQLVRLYDLSRDHEQALAGHEGEVWSADFVDDDTLVSVAAEDVARRWDLANGGRASVTRRRFEGARHVRVAANRMVVAGRSDVIRSCTLDTGECSELRGHTGPVEDIELSSDGRTLVSASADTTVRLWDLDTGEHRTYRGHTGTVFDVELRSDFIYSAGADGRVIRWQRKAVR